VRNAFLISEVALAFVLVVSTGLLVRTVFSMSAADAGFVSDGVLTFQVSLPSAKYAETAQMTELYRRLLEAMRVVPGVASAGLVSEVPMGGATDGTSIRIPEHPRTSENEHSFANYLFASPGYFSTLGTPLIRGRDFLATDTLASPQVTVINRSMAEKYWPGEDPIGKEVGVESTKWPTRVIVGIVADVKRASLREDPDPEMYVPYTQNEIRAWPSMQTMQVALRSEGNPAQLTPFVREAMRNVDPDLPMSNVATLAHLVNNSMVQWKFSLLLVGSFGGLALAMAMIGIYGVMSVSVQQQTRAIGIRVAMGATRENILRMILVAGAKLAATGVVIGLLTAWMVTRAMEKFLYGVRPTDPVTFATVSSLLMVAALIACLLPALHATRVDPLVALRSE
jgi:putative ABC transport system permease protein